MSFYEVRIHLGFPADLVIDTNLSGALWWLKQLEEHVGTLGHEGTRMTSQVYRHVVTPSIGAAAGPMGEIFGERL